MSDSTFVFGMVIAALIGIFVAADAKKRGMSMAWGLGVFVLLILFLPLYFIVRKPKLDQTTAAAPTYPPAAINAPLYQQFYPASSRARS